jgi:hypothetical protein
VADCQAKLQAILPSIPTAKCPAQLLLISQWFLRKRPVIKSTDAYVSPSLDGVDVLKIKVAVTNGKKRITIPGKPQPLEPGNYKHGLP